LNLTVLTTKAHRGERTARFDWIDIPDAGFFPRNFCTIPAALKRLKPDLYHASYWTRFWAEPVPSILTVHDISYALHPEWYGWQHHTFMAQCVRQCALRTRHVLTVSEFSKRELMEHWRIPEEKITVAYNGVDACFRPAGSKAGSRELGAGSSLSDPAPHAPRPTPPYILYVGNLHPRKNLARLLEAFVLLKKDGRFPHVLKIAGQKAWLYGDIFKTVRRHGLEKHVEFTGYVGREDLVRLYQNADVLAYPSLYEGFGLPVLEAMASGCPAVCSATTALPEVAGAACRQVDPGAPESIAAGLGEVLASEEQRKRMREDGLARAARFTWRACAEGTLEAYRKALGQS
jgi:glycosyltransferase involved in cell wall biosynthesis